MAHTRVQLVSVVRWEARDNGLTFTGSYDVVTRDIGATIGVGVYKDGGDTLIHSFYAHTRSDSYAQEITRDLVQATVARIQADYGARNVVRRFAETFPLVAYEAGHNNLDPSHLRNNPIGG